jgi:hypothetical protein
MMNVIRASLLLALLLLAMPGCARDTGGQVLQQAEIEAMLARMQVASQAMDADALAPFFAADASFDFTITSQGDSQRMRMNRSEYLQSIRNARQVTSSYQYRPGTPRISIAADGLTAEVSQSSSEVMVVMGQRVSGQSDGVYRIRVSADGPTIYSATGSTRLKF